MNKSFVLLFALTVSSLGISAQETMPVTTSSGDDFGTDVSLELEKKIAPGISFGIEANHRTQKNAKRTDRWQLGGEFDMRLFRSEDKRVTAKAGLGFTYTWRQKLGELAEHYDEQTGVLNGYNDTDSYWRHRTRTSTSIGISYAPSKRWEFSLKETFQYNHYLKGDSVYRVKYRYNDDDELYNMEAYKQVGPKDKMMLRSKFSVAYNIKRCPVDPFASVEYIAGQNHAERWKYTAGVDYKIIPAIKFSVFYRYQKENDDDDPDGHFAGCALKFNL